MKPHELPYHYRVGGIRIASELALPELEPIPGDTAIDVRIHLGPVDTDLEGATLRRPLYQVAPERFLFQLETVGRFLVLGGDEVRIDVQKNAPLETVRLLLLGTVLGVLYHRRGLIPLHASTLVVNDRAVAFAGHSGAGKSTLAAALSGRGYAVLADDVCPVDTSAPGGPTVLPGVPRFRLWTDSLDALEIDRVDLSRVRPELEKFVVRNERATSTAHLLDRIYVLSEVRGGPGPQIEGLGGAAALDAVMEQTYRWRIARELGDDAERFRRSASIVRQVSVRSLERPARLTGLDALVDLVEADLADLGTASSRASDA